MIKTLTACTELRACAAIVVLAIIAASAARGQLSPIGIPGLADLHPNQDAIYDAKRQIRAAGCRDQQCRSIVLVARAMDIMEAATDSIMGLAKPLPPNLPEIIERRWRREILSRPELFPVICDTIVGLAARYDGSEHNQGDRFIATGVIQLAARMDGKRGACLPRVMAAFQRNPAAETVINDMRGACPYAWKPWGVPCDRIAR
jgi:hypothetical protein